MGKEPVTKGIILPAAMMLGVLLCILGCRDQARNGESTGDFEDMTSATQNQGKDLTLLHGDPHRQTDSLPDRIRRLQREIARGEAVYTREELALLERKLADAEAQLRVIEHP